jgi:acetyl esterase/lipase
VVVDFALTLPSVDPARIALAGWSFGGYLAPRAASGEQRLAALIADPGQWDLIAAMRAIFRRLGVSAEVAKALPDVDEAAIEPAFAAIRENPQLNWSFVQRGLWVHGVRTLMDYLRVCVAFRLSDRVSAIRCPTLVTTAENDPVAAFAGRLYDALMCPKTLIRFTAAEGAGDHVGAVSLFPARLRLARRRVWNDRSTIAECLNRLERSLGHRAARLWLQGPPSSRQA